MLLLYSINSWLAFKVSESYYKDNHYVWCCPLFNAKDHNPPSSDPNEIYNGLLKDVQRGDEHSPKIKSNRTGIISGAIEKKKAGVITDDQYAEIVEIVTSAELKYFRPIIFVIPYHRVESIVKPASMKMRANFFSKEFIVEELKREDFDVIDISEN